MKSLERTARILLFPAKQRRTKSQYEFLPAALEIIETPASPAGRAIGVAIVGFFVVALLWACLGEVDIIATAPGRIVPSGRTKVIQPFATGVVRAIHVEDGQKVKAGDVLIELDPTIDAAEHDRLKSELTAAELDVARLKAVFAPNPDEAFTPPADAAPEQIVLQRAFLDSQIAEIATKLANLDRQIAESDANRAAVEATVAKLTIAIPLLEERVKARKYLADKGYGSKLTYLEIEQDLVEHQQELETQKARLSEAWAALAALQQQRKQAEAEARRNTLSDLAIAEQKVNGLRQQVIQAGQRRDLETLTAPVDGTVQQLAVHTIGGVVTPAQAVAVIVPWDTHLEIEANVANLDIGFVHAGDKAEVKVDTFNFTKYGLLHGTVVNISQDAVIRGSLNESASKPREEDNNKTQQDESVYVARVLLDRATMQIGDKLVALAPGMAVTAEIRTGHRRVIEYLLSPVLRYKQEALRER